MQILINITKTHAVLLALLIVLSSVTLLTVATGFTATQPSHAVLFTDTIRGKTSGLVNILDSIITTTASGQNFLTVTASGSANAGARFSNGIEANNFVFTRGTDGALVLQTANSDRLTITRTGATVIGGSVSIGSLLGAGLSSCSGANQKLLYDSSSGTFSCSADNSGITNCVQRVGPPGTPPACQSGEKLTGGGCECGPITFSQFAQVMISKPTANSWQCLCHSTGNVMQGQATVICCS